MADENVENTSSYLDLLEGGEFETYIPLTSETQAYLDWESTASRDRFSEEYAEARFPNRGQYGSGNLALPEWFPPEYAAFANTMLNSSMPSVSSMPDVDEIYGDPDNDIGDLLAQAMEYSVGTPPIIGITPEDTLAKNTTSEDFWNPELEVLVPNPNFDASTLPSQFDQVVNNTTTLYDPTKIRTLSGETIAEQDWFTPEKEEVLRTYFADVVNASDPNFFQDIPSMSKGIAWGEFVKALRAGVDPDALWGELEKVADKPNEYWENAKGLNSVFAEGNVAYNVQVMTAERSIEMFDEFTYKLGELRATDPDIYQEIYAYLPIEDKLLYLSDLQSKGSLTKEEYEGLYIQEVNSNYDPEKTPDNYKFVEIEGEVYLDTSGSRELIPSMDLINANFYPDDTSDDPLTKYKNSQDVGRAANGFGTRTDDFDPSFFDTLDPIVNIITMIPGIGPIIGATYTAIKGLSGETLHTSDWLRAAPGIIDGINVQLASAVPPIPPIPTTLGEVFPNLPLPFDVTLEVGGGAGAEMTREDGGPFSISDLIILGDAVLNAPSDPVNPYNPDGSPKRGKYGNILTREEIRAYESGTMVQLGTTMTQAGVPVPEGAFEVDPQTGMFTNLNGESVGFKEIFIAALDLFREEKPKEFAVEIVRASENEDTAQSLSQILGAAVYNTAQFLVDDSKQEKLFGGENSAAQQSVAMILSSGGELLGTLNALLTIGDKYPDNTEIAKLANNLIALGDSSNTDNVKQALENLDKMQEEYVKEDLFDNEIGNSMANAAKFYWGAAKENPLGVGVQIGQEIIQEGVPLAVGALAASAASVVLGPAAAAGAISAATAKIVSKFVGLSTAAATDIAEAGGGAGKQAFDSYLGAQNEVEFKRIQDSSEFAKFRKTADANGNYPSAEQQKEYVSNILESKQDEFRENAAALVPEAVGMGMALATGSLALGGLAADKLIIKKVLGDNVTEYLTEGIKKVAKEAGEGAGALGKEGLSEYGEEFYIEGFIKTVAKNNFDPSITTEEVFDSAAHAGTQAAVVSAGVTSGSLAAASLLSDWNPKVAEAMQRNPDGSPKLTAEGITQVMEDAGIDIESFPRVHAVLLDNVYDEAYTSPQEANEAFVGLDYQPTSAEIDAYIGNEFNDESLGSAIDTYVDPRQLTPDEVNAWAASNGITLTDDQVAELAIQYPDSFNTNDRLLDLLGDGTKVTDLNGNNIPDGFETGVIDVTDGTKGVDTDEDGVLDEDDAFPNDPSESVDTDGDGLGDNSDKYPNDPSEDGLTSIPNEDTGGTDVFDNNGNRVSSIDGQGNTTTYNDDGSSETKNSDNQVTSTTDSGGDITTYQYNGDGSYSTTNSTTGVQTNYDPDGKVIPPDDNETTTTTTGGDGSTTTTTTGVDGSTTVVTDDGKGTVTTVVTDSNGLETTNSTTTNTGDGNTTTTNNIDNSSTTNNTYNTDNSTTTNTTTNTTNVINYYGLSADSLTDVEEGIKDLIAAGLTRDQAIESIATQLGITEGNILDAIDTQTSTITDAIDDQTTTLQTDIDDQTTTLQTDIDDQTTTLQTDIAGSTDAILERSNEIESAGIARDQALSTAINEVSTQLGTTRTELLNRIGETEQTLLTRLGEVESTVIQGQQELGEDIQLVADYVGKDVGQVTDADIDFVADVIAQQEANTELAVLTQQQLQYDVNDDGVIDINDQTMLEQAQAGQDVDFARMFNPTGLYEVNQQTQQDIQTAQDLNTQQNLNTQQQIESTRQRGNEEELLRDILGSSDLTGGKASTQQMGTANINYLYDIGGDSVFAPNARTNLFSPYGASNVVPAIQPQARQIRQQPRAAAQGGLLSRNNELLRLLGED